MSIEQHLVALRGVRLQDKGAAGTEFQVCRQNLAPHPANDQPLFAPVELEGFAQFESQRNVGFDQCLSSVLAPASNKLGDPTVIAAKTGGL